MSLAPSFAATGDELPSTDDPRYDLDGGFFDAEVAASGIEQVGHLSTMDTPFAPPAAPMPGTSGISWANSDMAFSGDHVIQGNYQGFQVYDVSDPTNPTLRTTMLCPGGQSDVNVYGNLLFQSVEENRGRVDCGIETTPGSVASDTRFRGVRIWDISDLDNPVQVAGIQTCRGSHTNRLVEDPDDPDHVYIYNNGTGGQRNAAEKVHTPDGLVAGRCGQTDPNGANPSQWMIEVIKVPVANPEAAAVVKEARLFTDPATGAVNGLQNGPTQPSHPCATTPNPDGSGSDSCSPARTNYSPSPNTNTCHDITAYPEIGLAAGACQGNGILIDISDPADPVRIDAVSDPNFAYWHSANFNNDGTTVMFTDEWGGGVGARCAPAHRSAWGANAMFTIDRSGATPKLEFQSYYKLPAAQSAAENCVAHQANLLPVPGRDVVIQAWYQGGMSLFDMSDPGNPFEIGYWDRGPITSPGLTLGGFWSSYWYNGNVYGSEIARGLDVMEVTPTEHLSANELAAAKTVQLEEHNAMAMRSYSWPPTFHLVRAYADQLERVDGGIAADKLANVRKAVDKAEAASETNAKNAVAQLRAASNQLDGNDPAHADLRSALADLMKELG